MHVQKLRDVEAMISTQHTYGLHSFGYYNAGTGSVGFSDDC